MSALALTCFILAGLYIRERRTSARLRAGEQFARECMRDAVRSRDALSKDFFDERARYAEALIELEHYRAEDMCRQMLTNEQGKVWAN